MVDPDASRKPSSAMPFPVEPQSKYHSFFGKSLKYLGFPLGVIVGMLMSKPPSSESNAIRSSHKAAVSKLVRIQPQSIIQNKVTSSELKEADLLIPNQGVLGDIIIDGKPFNPVKSLFSKFQNTVIDPATSGLVEGFAKHFGLNSEQELFVNMELKKALASLVDVEKQNVTVTTDQAGAQTLQIRAYEGEILRENLRKNLRGKLQPVQADLLTAVVSEDITFGFSGKTALTISADHFDDGSPEGSELESVFVRYQYHAGSDKILDTASHIMSRKAYLERYGPLVSGTLK